MELVYDLLHMSKLQKVTLAEKPIDDYSPGITDYRYQALIDFRALNGLITDDDGMHRMTVAQLATALGTIPKILYDWQKRIPEFWYLVAQRRKQIAPHARVAKVHDVMYMSALKPGSEGFRDRQLWLANFDEDFRMPTEKIEHEVGDSWARLLEMKRQSSTEMIEAEIIDDKTSLPPVSS